VDTGTNTYLPFKSTVVFAQDTDAVVEALLSFSWNVIVPVPACTVSVKVRRYVKSFKGLFVSVDEEAIFKRFSLEYRVVGLPTVPARATEAKLRARNANRIIV
jgi:hypothetical protein